MTMLDNATVTVTDIPNKEVLAEIEDQVVNTVTLADLLREAEAMGIKQTTGTYIAGENEACALGAAYLVAKKRGLI